MQTSQLSTGTAMSQPSDRDELQREEAIEQEGGDFEESVAGKMLEVEDRKSTENPRAYSDMSSLSESVYLGTFEDKVGMGKTISNQRLGKCVRQKSIRTRKRGARQRGPKPLKKP